MDKGMDIKNIWTWGTPVRVHFHCHLDSELRVCEFDNIHSAKQAIKEAFTEGLPVPEYDCNELISITVFPPHLLGCPIIVEA